MAMSVCECCGRKTQRVYELSNQTVPVGTTVGTISRSITANYSCNTSNFTSLCWFCFDWRNKRSFFGVDVGPRNWAVDT